MSETRLTIGLDLGQASDYTAVAVIESEWLGEFKPELETRIRHLERWRGISYVEVVDRLVDLRSLPGLEEAALVTDATGVGVAVIDMLRDASLRPIPVTITAGDHAHQDEETSYWRVPKKELVGTISALLHRKRLKVARGLHLAETLIEELGSFEIRVTAAGNVQYGTWREGVHDDLVLAVALACWWARNRLPRASTGYHKVEGRRSIWGGRNLASGGIWQRSRGADPFIKCQEDANAQDFLGRAAWRHYVQKSKRERRR